jgi:rhodanese-related sulfurtransferase
MKNSGKYGLLVLLSLIAYSINYAQTTEIQLPKEKQTTPGLYVTAKEAYERWKAAPDKIKILDVRTPDEYMNIGHATMAWNIPAFIQTYNWDESKQHFSIKPNPDFMTNVKQVFKTDDIILVTCRSGGRSAWAVNQLATAGFKNIFNITDGMEGDTVDDPQSVYVGQRMKNGWKNSGIPWTHKVDPKLMILPKYK